MITLKLSDSIVKDIEIALWYTAQDEAGQSQAPNLCSAEETQDWYIADLILDLVKELETE